MMTFYTMDAKEIAASIHEELLEEVGDELLAVGWYSKAREPRTGSEYISEDFSEHEGKGRGVLENALLESLSHTAHESIHEEDILATIRHYETIIDIDVHLDEFKGIVIAVRPSDGYRIGYLLDAIREEVPESVGLSAER